jgi:hypothetical protein
MGNVVDVQLDVLASDPAEIKEIEVALQEPCDELIVSYAGWCNQDPVNIASDIKDVVAFKPTLDLHLAGKPVTARRFKNSFKRSWDLVWSHVHFVSKDFPKAIFLAEYWDWMGNYDGKLVIHAGNEIHSSHDDARRGQFSAWALLDIFAPYQSEYELGLEFGSLWDAWIEDTRKALADLAGDDNRSPARAACATSPNPESW